MRRLFAYLFLITFLLSIALRPIHFVLITHKYHPNFSKVSVVEHHKDCPLEKVWTIEGVLKFVSYQFAKFNGFVEYKEDFEEVVEFEIIDFNKLRAPPIRA